MTILVIAPHADDEVLGVGGVIAKFINEGLDVVVAVLTGHGEEKHPIWQQSEWSKLREEARIANHILGVKKLIFRELPAACLDYTPAWKINEIVTGVIQEVNPKEIYIPFSHDLHQDHGSIAYAAQVATRPYLPLGRSIRRILAYETLSETHLAAPYLAPAFQPNVFIDITPFLNKKLSAMEAYSSQIQPDNQPRSVAGLTALARIRGNTIGVTAAEAFFLIREVN